MAASERAAAQVFQALGDGSRLAMVGRLASGPASLSELARPLDITVSAAGQHLKVLEGCGLVSSSKAGRVRTCRLTPQGLDAVDAWVTQRRAELERRVDRLEDHLARGGSEVPEPNTRHATIVVDRHLDASPERVYRAWTVDRGDWDVPSDDWVIAEQEDELRVDGITRSRFGPKEDPAFESRGRYLVLDEGRLLIMAGAMYGHDVASSATLTTVEVVPDGDGTRLIVTDQSAYFADETPEMREPGMRKLVERLERHLAAA